MERNEPKVTKDREQALEWTDRGVPAADALKLSREARRAEKLGAAGRVRAMKRLAARALRAVRRAA